LSREALMILFTSLGFLLIGLISLSLGRPDQKGRKTVWVRDASSKWLGWPCLIIGLICVGLFVHYGS
jgi:hypothetical protein